MNLLQFWGKARSRNLGGGPEWHPLAYHCLDVAAVGDAFLATDHGFGHRIARLLGLSRSDAESLVRFLLGLHDIGKFAKKFQAKARSFYPKCFGDDPATVATHYDHGAGGLRLFSQDAAAFKLPANTRDRTWRPLVSAVTGHHGAPPEFQHPESLVVLRGRDFGAAGIEAAHEFIRQAHTLLALPRKLPALDSEKARRASFAVAGLAVLADWIGSNQEWFPYCEPNLGLEAYWAIARQRSILAAEGLYVALPTMATANAMFCRVATSHCACLASCAGL